MSGVVENVVEKCLFQTEFDVNNFCAFRYGHWGQIWLCSGTFAELLLFSLTATGQKTPLLNKLSSITLFLRDTQFRRIELPHGMSSLSLW